MKYHKSKFKRVGAMPVECCAQPKGKFHPLSYYLNGGIDLTGKELDKSAEVEYDTDEDLKELYAEGAMAVPYGDPRESKMSLIERYASVGEAMANAAPVNATVATTDTNKTE